MIFERRLDSVKTCLHKSLSTILRDVCTGLYWYLYWIRSKRCLDRSNVTFWKQLQYIYWGRVKKSFILSILWGNNNESRMIYVVSVFMLAWSVNSDYCVILRQRKWLNLTFYWRACPTGYQKFQLFLDGGLTISILSVTTILGRIKTLDTPRKN